MPTASPQLLRGWLYYQLARGFKRLPRPAQKLALFIWGLWQLAGELIYLVDVVTAYPYPARNDRK